MFRKNRNRNLYMDCCSSSESSKWDYVVRKINTNRKIKGITTKDMGDCIILKLWNNCSITIPKCSKFTSMYDVQGDYDIGELDELTNGELKFSTTGGFSTYARFSGSREDINRFLADNGKSNRMVIPFGRELRGKYNINIESGNVVKVSVIVGHNQSFNFNGIQVSDSVGPDELIERFGMPSIHLHIPFSVNYPKTHEVGLLSVSFRWGSVDDKCSIVLRYDMSTLKQMFYIILN